MKKIILVGTMVVFLSACMAPKPPPCRSINGVNPCGEKWEINTKFRLPL